MSAEIEVKDGRKSMFSARASVWHDPQNAVVLPDNPTWDEARELARWNYPVQKLPVEIVMPDGSRKPSEKSFAIVRTDSGRELGRAGKEYECVQNDAAFHATMRTLVDDGTMVLETGGVLADGGKAWLAGRLNPAKFGPGAREVFGDELVPYAVTIVDHTGKNANSVAFTTIRPVCANTVRMVEHSIDGGHERGIRVTHSGDVHGKLADAAREIFSVAVKDAEAQASEFKALKSCTLTPTEFELIVERTALGPHPTMRANWNADARMASAVVERYERKSAELERLWHRGSGHVDDASAWEAYNAVVELLDHNRELFPIRTGVYRTQSLLSGRLRQTKDKVYEVLLEHATGEDSTVLDAILAEQAA